jgi:hypothetical protein
VSDSEQNMITRAKMWLRTLRRPETPKASSSSTTRNGGHLEGAVSKANLAPIRALLLEKDKGIAYDRAAVDNFTRLMWNAVAATVVFVLVLAAAIILVMRWGDIHIDFASLGDHLASILSTKPGQIGGGITAAGVIYRFAKGGRRKR